MARTSNSARKSTGPEPPLRALKTVGGAKGTVGKAGAASKNTPGTGDKSALGTAGTGSTAGKTLPPRPVAGKVPAGQAPRLTVSTPKISQKPKPAPRKSSKNILREIKYYQNNIGFLIPRALLVRVVRQTLLATAKAGTPHELRFTSVSLNVLHEAVENHLVCIMELAYMAARHAKRVTLFPSDIRLINRIKGIAI